MHGNGDDSNEGFHCFIERRYQVLTEEQEELSTDLPASQLVDSSTPLSLHAQVEMPYRQMGGRERRGKPRRVVRPGQEYKLGLGYRARTGLT